MVDLERAYASVSARNARAYRSLGTLAAADFDAGLVIGANTLPRSAAATGLRKLAEAGLLLSTGEHPVRGPLYELGPVARKHARRLSRSCGEMDRPLEQLATWLVTNSSAVNELVTPDHARLRHSCTRAHHRLLFATPHDALQWLESQHRNCMTVLRAAAEEGMHEFVWQLVHAMWPAWRQYRRYSDWILAHELAVRAADACKESAASLVLATTLGIALRSTGRYEEALALLTEVLNQARQDSDQRMAAQALHEIGSTHLACGRLTAARRALNEARALHMKAGAWLGAALTGITYARIDLVQGQPAVAARRLVRAMDQLTRAGDSYNAARARAYLSRACSLAGDTESARHHARLAHAFFRAGAPHLWSARSLEYLGLTEQDAGNPEAARVLLGKACTEYGPISRADAERLQHHPVMA
ncbi:tetratricopeptide repeat protein [Streptomyces sp. NPDC059604]|uniref:tetratricopeptide repeat protein n=1 Tax=Streptomyces sp. NPDC059604 TaxID=3346881 RepID=UPI0036936FA1